MSEYQRILSYLYRYENGNKKECKGFIKAEQRNGSLKITIQMEGEHLMEDMPLMLCFYRQDGEEWKLHVLDQLPAGKEEEVLTYPLAILPEGTELTQMNGVLLYYQETLYYGSVWIGEEIPMESLRSQLEKPTTSEEMEPEKEEGKAEPEMVPEERLEPDHELESESESEPETEMEAETGPEPESEPESEPEVEAEVESALKEYKIEEEPSSVDCLEALRTQAPAAEHIFHPAFYEGYQITPRQLPLFCEEAETLAKNQFLLKGCEKYHHLLAGKVRYEGRARYCVGVPGIYENREKYMAELYQFPIFLALTENRVKTGGPGYWLHLLPI